MKKIAIHGFGRIGKASLKIILDTAGLEVVAVNDLMSLENAAYLFKCDGVNQPLRALNGLFRGKIWMGCFRYSGGSGIDGNTIQTRR